MIAHYLKVAFRSLMKYKMQTAVSIVGLAVGFVCFAFSMIWIRYELTYDSFHPGAERIYIVYGESKLEMSGYSTHNVFPLANAIHRDFPEVESAASFYNWEALVELDGRIEKLDRIEVDTAFIRMFGVRLLGGNWNFLRSPDEIAITEETALQLFGTTDVMGCVMRVNGVEVKISALVSGFGKHTNMPYGIMAGVKPEYKESWNMSNFTVCFRLKKGVNEYAFAGKLGKHEFKEAEGVLINNLQMKPITECHYTLLKDANSISLTYVWLFALVGLLVILVALINFFSLLVVRIRIRSRELALRVSCGSSLWGLFVLFASELLLVLLTAAFFGMILVELFEKKFCELSGVYGDVVSGSVIYFAAVLLLSFLVAMLVITVYSRKSLSSLLHGAAVSSGRGMTVQQAGICVQMTVSVLILFGLSGLFSQLYYLKHINIGFERDGRATLVCPHDCEKQIAHAVKELPYVTKVKENMYSLLPRRGAVAIGFKNWDGKQPSDEAFSVQVISEGEEFIDFYGISMLKGECRLDSPDKVIVNETAARRLGWAEPIGKKLYSYSMDAYTVVGVMKDVHFSAPTIPVEPLLLIGTKSRLVNCKGNILIRFDEEKADELKTFCRQWMETHFPGEYYLLQTVNDVYDEYLTSENALLRLLLFVSLVCVGISLFGVYSHVTLSCERRRKEIAIRKVNGATSADIIRSFLRQYFYLLLFSCVIALPLGTFVMLHWLEQYVERTPLYWWIYAGIVAVMYVFVVLCIGRSVWRAANENPAEVIKSE